MRPNYDASNQLTAAGSSSYSYDANGNRTLTGYATGTDNQLQTDGTWNYSYDGEGNLTKKVKATTGETWTYGYTDGNQLAWAEDRASDGGTLLTHIDYSYDVYGNRLAETLRPPTGPAVVTAYAYDGWNAQQDANGQPASYVGTENWNVYAVLNGNNGDSISTRALYGDAVDQLFARLGSSGAAWYLSDREGSVKALTDGTGAVQDRVAYDGFGQVTSESNPSFGDNLKYAGRPLDTATGLYNDRQRMYDPATGRFQSQDLIDADVNSYRYAGNAPTDATDPSGLEGQDAATQEWNRRENEKWQGYRNINDPYERIKRLAKAILTNDSVYIPDNSDRHAVLGQELAKLVFNSAFLQILCFQ